LSHVGVGIIVNGVVTTILFAFELLIPVIVCLTDVLAGELSTVLTAGLSGLGSTTESDSYNFATDFHI